MLFDVTVPVKFSVYQVIEFKVVFNLYIFKLLKTHLLEEKSVSRASFIRINGADY